MLTGVTTIRAFDRTSQFMDQHRQAVDENTSLFLLFWLTSRWLAIRLDYLGIIVMLIFSMLAVTLTGGHGGLSPNMLGLGLVYSTQLTGLLQWTVRLCADLENNLTAMERLEHFLQLPVEAPTVTEIRPPSDWPDKGEIVIKDLSARYRPELDPVLRGLTLTVKAGEKVGICGRTGTGKSSLTQVLLRMVEPDQTAKDGLPVISIDGIKICRVGLDDLRSRLTISFHKRSCSFQWRIAKQPCGKQSSFVDQFSPRTSSKEHFRERSEHDFRKFTALGT